MAPLNQFKQKKLYRLLLIVMILLLIIIIGIGVYDWNSQYLDNNIFINKNIFVKIPSEIIEWSDYYIISKTGEAYFRNNYKFNLQGSSSPEGNKNKVPYGWYYLAYEYIPLTNLAGKPIFVTVSIHTDVTSFYDFKYAMENHIGLKESWVACLKDGIPCDFKISQNKALEIIQALNILELSSIKKSDIFLDIPRDYELINNSFNSLNWAAYFSRPDPEDSYCSIQYKVLVDIESGQSSTKVSKGGCV